MDKNIVEVVIGGKVYHLGGDESEEYMQRLASYLNHKIGQLKENENYLKLSPDAQSFHLALSAADDYMKLNIEMQEKKDALEEQDETIYAMKNELVDLQVKNQSLQKQLNDYKEEVKKLEAKNVNNNQWKKQR